MLGLQEQTLPWEEASGDGIGEEGRQLFSSLIVLPEAIGPVGGSKGIESRTLAQPVAEGHEAAWMSPTLKRSFMTMASLLDELPGCSDVGRSRGGSALSSGSGRTAEARSAALEPTRLLQLLIAHNLQRSCGAHPAAQPRAYGHCRHATADWKLPLRAADHWRLR